MNPSDYHAFLDQVEDELRRRQVAHTLDAAEGAVRLTSPRDRDSALGLINLAQICHQHPRKEWPAIVGDHVERMLRAGPDCEALLNELEADFDRARELLKVRLYSGATAGRDFAISRSPMEDVDATLVYDLPDSVVSVHKDHLAAWGRPADELFEIGLANVRAGDPVRTQTFPIEGDVALTLLGGESFFAASHALFLRDYLPAEAPFGALVAVPHRHAVVFHPIADGSALVAINALIPVALGMYQEGPGSISPHLYWWDDGRFVHLPYQVNEQTLEFQPPDEFIRLLDRLAP